MPWAEGLAAGLGSARDAQTHRCAGIQFTPTVELLDQLEKFYVHLSEEI